MAHLLRMAMRTPVRCTGPSAVSSSIRMSNKAVRKPRSFVSQLCTTPRPFASMLGRHDADATSGLHLSNNTAIRSRPNSLFIKVESFSTVREGSGAGKGRRRKRFIPVRAAVELSDRARTFFSRLLANPPRADVVGVRLNYRQSQTGEPRMVFTFDFVTKEELDADDEPVSLEVVQVVDKSDGQTRWVPKPPRDSLNDGLPKLYVSSNSFFKVLGATVDVDTETLTPILHDQEGNRIDPNA